MSSSIPNLFIIGAPKAGTTALAHNLAQHKEVFISDKKEPRFFDAHTFYDNKEDYPIKNLDEYLSLYDNEISRRVIYRMDASVFNMYSEKSIKEILKISPDAKFIIMLREPVSASLSMHRQRLTYIDPKMREMSDDFMTCWRLLEKRRAGEGYPKGCRNRFLFRYDLIYKYELYLPTLIEMIEKDHLFIGFYDEFKVNPEVFYKKVFKFLGINTVEIENKKINESVILKNSVFLKIINNFATSTVKIRKRIGLSGGKMTRIRKVIFHTFSIKPVSMQVDNEVDRFFLNTNLYIEQVKRDFRC